MGHRVAVVLRTCLAALLSLLLATQSGAETSAPISWRVTPAYQTPVGDTALDLQDGAGAKRRIYEESYAVIIAQGDYRGGGWDPVAAAAKANADALREKLEASGYRVIVWKDLNGDDLRTVVHDVAGTIGYKSGARLFFYYFGHGSVLNEGGDEERTFLVPVDAPNPNTDEPGFFRAALPVTELAELARQMLLRHAIFVLEACRAGEVIAHLDGPPPVNPQGYLFSKDRLNPARQFLTAGNAGEDVPADAAFTALVRGGLEDGDTNGDGYITGTELMNYVTQKLPQYRRVGYPQNPEAGIIVQRATGGDMIIAPAHARAVAAGGGDLAVFKAARENALGGNVEAAVRALPMLSDPAAQHAVQWLLSQEAAQTLSFADREAFGRNLTAWPGGERRREEVERSLAATALPPVSLVRWFGDTEPMTAEGAIALAAAYEVLDLPDRIQKVVLRAFVELDTTEAQRTTLLTRWGQLLGSRAYTNRVRYLIDKGDLDATLPLLPKLDAGDRQLTEERLRILCGALTRSDPPTTCQTLRQPQPQFGNAAVSEILWLDSASVATQKADSVSAIRLITSAPAFVAPLPARTYETLIGLALLGYRQAPAPDRKRLFGTIAFDNPSLTSRMRQFVERLSVAMPTGATALRAGLTPPLNPTADDVAEQLYWRARDAEGNASPQEVQTLYASASRIPFTFYGFAAAAGLSDPEFSLDRPPNPTAADKARFEDRELVRAARLLADSGDLRRFDQLARAIADELQSAEELKLLIDLARQYSPASAVIVQRAAVAKGFPPIREGYPVINLPAGWSKAREALTLAVIRRESGFMSDTISPAGARGYFQIMPATYHDYAARHGRKVEDYAAELADPATNAAVGMELLERQAATFGRNVAVSAAAMNAGPGNATRMLAGCGHWKATAHPEDFIQCIPFAETRNYVRGVLEDYRIYLAILEGGTTKVRLPDLFRDGSFPN